LPSDDRSPTDLPSPPRAQGHYLPAVATDALVLTAGMTPRVDGQLLYAGQVGGEIDVPTAARAASIAAANAVAAAAELLGSTGLIRRALRLTVFVNAVPGFTAHSAVADGASARLVELLGERGVVARSAIGVSSLPGGACVEVELTCTR
jgi:enamine deaminase RidA (YjgF/YER057c/UK114 family)